MRVLILGGDGYLGWPTAMHFTACGHKVAVADNYLRRNVSREHNVEPLCRVPNLTKRVNIWRKKTGYDIDVYIGDLAQWDFISDIFEAFKPECIIHYAEQPSAPFSMLDRNTARLTLQNNLLVTANVIFATKQYSPEAHIVKLGTMGEYGTPNIDIEEGWIEISHKNRSDRFLYPRQASSLYHTTKIMDTDLLWFYVRMWNLRVTDLMQGPVYGLFTDENRADETLLPFFSYDELFGTVINRFIVQAVAGYPLTIYGKGEQTRGYINIKDTLNCVRLSAEHPADKGELRIFNQFTETFSVNDIGRRVQMAGNKIGLNVEIQHIKNPRKELEEHYYNPVHTGLIELGLVPNYLTDQTLIDMMEYVNNFKDKIDGGKFIKNVTWDK